MKLGIIGAGGIAEIVAPTLMQLQEIECYAVASRLLEKAEHFAAKYGFSKAYGSYKEMLTDPNVELVYIATPHSHHYEHTMMALRAGKPVLCEKAFTMNARQAKEIRDFAREKGLYVAEAIWPRYMPSRKIISKVIASGIIGKPNVLTGDILYAISHNKRLMDPNLAGGALLDIGVYGLNFALMHFGSDIERIESSVQMTQTGVDGMETVTIFYKDGRMAVLTHSICSHSNRMGVIHGDKGYIVVENVVNPQSIEVFDTENRLVEKHSIPEQISGYEYEFLEAVRCIREGKLESESMPMADTIFVMERMDDLRRKWGLRYPQEQ